MTRLQGTFKNHHRSCWWCGNRVLPSKRRIVCLFFLSFPNSGVTLEVLSVRVKAGFDRGCSRAVTAAAVAADSLLFTLHSCLSRSSKCILTAQARRNCWPRAGTSPLRSRCGAVRVFRLGGHFFVAGTREPLWWSQVDLSWPMQGIGADVL